MATVDIFNGVACCCLDRDRTATQTINKLLVFNGESTQQEIACQDLKLKNKYYETTIHLFDYDSLPADKKFDKSLMDACHAIVIYANGQTMTTDQLDLKKDELDAVCGEPRILLVDKITADCEAQKNILDWAIKNGFDFINVDEEEDVKKSIIDSLSAYKWPNRTDTPAINKGSATPNSSNQTASSNGETGSVQLNEETLKQLVDFDNLLGKLSEYRDNPELRGNPNDKNIEEIAEILSNLLGDDVDNLLSDLDSP